MARHLQIEWQEDEATLKRLYLELGYARSILPPGITQESASAAQSPSFCVKSKQSGKEGLSAALEEAGCASIAGL